MAPRGRDIEHRHQYDSKNTSSSLYLIDNIAIILVWSFLSSNINLGQGLQVSVRRPDIIIVLYAYLGHTEEIIIINNILPERTLKLHHRNNEPRHVISNNVAFCHE